MEGNAKRFVTRAGPERIRARLDAMVAPRENRRLTFNERQVFRARHPGAPRFIKGGKA
jgi:hypothetical protein